MWVDYKKAPNLMIAEAWKEILEGEGLPVRLLPQTDICLLYTSDAADE